MVTSRAEMSWLIQVLCDLLALGWHFQLQKFILIGSHPLPHLSQLPNIEPCLLPSPPASMYHIVSHPCALSFSTVLVSWSSRRHCFVIMPKYQRTRWPPAFVRGLTSVCCYWSEVTSFELTLGSCFNYNPNCSLFRMWYSLIKFALCSLLKLQWISLVPSIGVGNTWSYTWNKYLIFLFLIYPSHELQWKRLGDVVPERNRGLNWRDQRIKRLDFVAV